MHFLTPAFTLAVFRYSHSPRSLMTCSRTYTCIFTHDLHIEWLQQVHFTR